MQEGGEKATSKATMQGRVGDRVGDSDPSYMSFLSDPTSNLSDWSEPAIIFEDYVGSDTNFAPLILSNGSIVALWRKWTGCGHALDLPSLYLFLSLSV